MLKPRFSPNPPGAGTTVINHRFHFDSIPAAPWKNGGGVTRQIAQSGPGDPFWRLSIAVWKKTGRFPVFRVCAAF